MTTTVQLQQQYPEIYTSSLNSRYTRILSQNPDRANDSLIDPPSIIFTFLNRMNVASFNCMHADGSTYHSAHMIVPLPLQQEETKPAVLLLKELMENALDIHITDANLPLLHNVINCQYILPLDPNQVAIPEPDRIHTFIKTYHLYTRSPVFSIAKTKQSNLLSGARIFMGRFKIKEASTDRIFDAYIPCIIGHQDRVIKINIAFRNILKPLSTTFDITDFTQKVSIPENTFTLAPTDETIVKKYFKEHLPKIRAKKTCSENIDHFERSIAEEEAKLAQWKKTLASHEESLKELQSWYASISSEIVTKKELEKTRITNTLGNIENIRITRIVSNSGQEIHELEPFCSIELETFVPTKIACMDRAKPLIYKAGGPYFMRLDLSSPQFLIKNKPVSCSPSGRVHPHSSTTYNNNSFVSTCLGEIQSPLYQACNDLNITSILLLIKQWLTTCNLQDGWGQSAVYFMNWDDSFETSVPAQQKEYSYEIINLTTAHVRVDGKTFIAELKNNEVTFIPAMKVDENYEKRFFGTLEGFKNILRNR